MIDDHPRFPLLLLMGCDLLMFCITLTMACCGKLRNDLKERAEFKEEIKDLISNADMMTNAAFSQIDLRSGINNRVSLGLSNRNSGQVNNRLSKQVISNDVNNRISKPIQTNNKDFFSTDDADNLVR